MRTLALLAACLCLATAFAQAPSPQSPPPPAPSPPAKLADVAWIQGYWDGEGMGGTVEDLWMPPRAGVMLGAFRLVKPEGVAGGFYELFAIEEFEGSLRFVAKHFGPDWIGWEEKDKALKVRLTRIGPEGFAFGGIVFTREGADGLRVDLSMRGKEGQPGRTEVMRFKRRPL